MEIQEEKKEKVIKETYEVSYKLESNPLNIFGLVL